jgi:hypothetical protein
LAANIARQYGLTCTLQTGLAHADYALQYVGKPSSTPLDDRVADVIAALATFSADYVRGKATGDAARELGIRLQRLAARLDETQQAAPYQQAASIADAERRERERT